MVFQIELALELRWLKISLLFLLMQRNPQKQEDFSCWVLTGYDTAQDLKRTDKEEKN